ncbi:HD domain-containing protein [Acrocarpospora macrocephala]|uniref:HD domain-containing protein n=1 Tax=Acrocarpospora macrocephala TaxID=150177 RepID=UPI001FE97B44|nr:HD domain-containing protein [Acrocarpospora macrocephala]
MTSAALERALSDLGGPVLRPLPDQVARLLRDLVAPPRLAAHLRAVHDVAYQLLDWIAREYPSLAIDREAVLFGAATHDIGKTIHTGELSGPGSAHEHAGYRLLLDHGVTEPMARFARTHADWTRPDIAVEDLLVSLADKIWKAKRVPDLEQLVVDHLALAAGQEPWQAFMDLDTVLTRLAEDADHRLAFQAGYPITSRT